MEGTVAQAIVNPDAGKTALSVRTVLTTHLRPLSFLPPVTSAFSIRSWVEADTPGFLFLTSDAATHEARRAMIATQLELALVALLSRPKSADRRLWFIIDELPTLHQIPSLASGLRESRQYGGAMVLGTQVFSELRDIYGREAATTIAGNCNTRLVLNSPDMDTSEWLSESLGRTEVERMEENISYGAAEIRDGVGLSRREQLQKLVLPSDIMRLQPLHGYVKMPHNLPVAKIILKPRRRKTLAPAFIARPRTDPLTGEVYEPDHRPRPPRPQARTNRQQRISGQETIRAARLFWQVMIRALSRRRMSACRPGQPPRPRRRKGQTTAQPASGPAQRTGPGLYPGRQTQTRETDKMANPQKTGTSPTGLTANQR